MTYFVSVSIFIITYDFYMEGTWVRNQVAGFDDRDRANRRWLELKARKDVRNIRTSVEERIEEREIRSRDDVLTAWETGQLSHADYAAVFYCPEAEENDEFMTDYERESEMDNMPVELDPRL